MLVFVGILQDLCYISGETSEIYGISITKLLVAEDKAVLSPRLQISFELNSKRLCTFQYQFLKST